MSKGTDGLYAKFVKRVLDIIFSVLLFIPSGIIVFFCYIAIKLETKGPAFFVQQRPGYKGRLFYIYKLRTMICETERDGRLLTDMERMTKTGKVIRSCSFDELPQIWNILKGEMSFVGPRPLLVEYLPLYSEEQMKRHDVLPGISGWAQVNGRNELTWEQKFEHDIWYVDNVSFALDFRIIMMTIRSVVQQRGINSAKNETMYSYSSTHRNEIKDTVSTGANE